ncbi:hypothetical protein HZH68_010047 [Vespula germanica]|uniref:Uncharacterized protein n=1 Tax=Vespula germanica TaxID=30212 RepID=A0A834JYH5_VESGE|nr:hypothetical protein HZH68_010047 [Vespula germanica]
MSTRGGIRLTVIRVRLIDGEACLSLNENTRETNQKGLKRVMTVRVISFRSSRGFLYGYRDKILGKKNDIAKKYNKKDLFELVDKKKRKKGKEKKEKKKDRLR